MKQIADIRKDYIFKSLSDSDTHPDAMTQFDQWWKEAISSEIDEVNAMSLATVGAEGKPSCRIVLLKGYDERCFVFFTNYESRKGFDLTHNPHAALTFFWKELERQIRIEGKVVKAPESESAEYFHSRPRMSQIGAWTSPQSKEIENRDFLEKKFDELTLQYEHEEIPYPKHWGGFILLPESIEFWQGRASRLHDRISYQKLENKKWSKVRLAP
jgi:pyridoxamine 5'-phosphate oxidase